MCVLSKESPCSRYYIPIFRLSMACANIVNTPITTTPKRKGPDTSPSPQSTDKGDLKRSRADSLVNNEDILKTKMSLDKDPPSPRSMDRLFEKLDQIDGRLALSATKADLLVETSKLVTKTQFDQLTTRIAQLETNCQTHAQRLDKIEGNNSSLRKDINAKISGQQHHPNRFVSPPRLNMLIEGLPVIGDPYKLVIELAKTLGMDLDRRDFSLIIRMKKRGEGKNQVATIMVCFTNMHVHDELFAKRFKLKTVESLKKVWLNLDEPEHVRKQKAKMRKIAFQARGLGLDAYYTHNMIRIDGKEYGIEDVDKIVLSKPVSVSSTYKAESVSSTKQVNRNDMTQSMPKPQRPPRKKHSSESASRQTNSNLIDLSTFVNPLLPMVRIVKTKAGITFQGPTAYMSNFYVIQFIFEGVRYQLVEQAYQFKFAMHHKKFDLAQKLLGKTSGYDIKDDVADIVPDPEWGHMCVPLLRALMYAKFSQNPELMDKLVATYPHPLIESTKDKTWGGGLPFGDPDYDRGIVKGENKCGKELTSIRDEEYRKRAAARFGQNVAFPNTATVDLVGATAKTP